MKDEIYEGYVITTNALPEYVTDFPTFGWALEARQVGDDTRFFRVIARSTYEGTHDDKEMLLNIVIDKAHTLIDDQEIDEKEHCFIWEQGNSELIVVDCTDLPGQRSPWR